MKDNAITWIIVLTLFMGLGLASLAFLIYMDEIIKGFFFT